MTAIPADVEQYLDAVEPERGRTLRAVFDVVDAAVPEGYVLGIHWGMPTWVVPLETYPDTYNGKPLGYVALAAQKRHLALYLMALYSDSDEDRRFREAWTATGRRLDMGKSCLRFRTLEDLDLDLVRETVAAFDVDDFLGIYERVRSR